MGWAMSNDNNKAMNYGTMCCHLQYFSRHCGFPGVLPIPWHAPPPPHAWTTYTHPAHTPPPANVWPYDIH